MKHLFVLLAALSFPYAGHAQTAITTKSGTYQSAGAGQYGLAVSGVTTLTVPAGSKFAEICAEVAGVRYTDDGSTPSAANGVPLVPASSTQPTCMQYAGPLSSLKFFQISGSPTLSVSYYK